MKYLLLSFFATIVLTACGQTKDPDKKQDTQVSSSIAKNVNASEAMAIMAKQGVQILDVRTAEETSHGMIKGAVNFDFHSTDFIQKASSLDKNRPVIVYCAVGGRSAKAMKQLQEAGFKEIYNVSQGYDSIK